MGSRPSKRSNKSGSEIQEPKVEIQKETIGINTRRSEIREPNEEMQRKQMGINRRVSIVGSKASP